MAGNNTKPTENSLSENTIPFLCTNAGAKTVTTAYKPSNKHDLRAALTNADAGEHIIYNVGTHLDHDHYARRLMMTLQGFGVVNLVQSTSQPASKIHCRIFNYTAIRTSQKLNRKLQLLIEEALS